MYPCLREGGCSTSRSKQQVQRRDKQAQIVKKSSISSRSDHLLSTSSAWTKEMMKEERELHWARGPLGTVGMGRIRPILYVAEDFFQQTVIANDGEN